MNKKRLIVIILLLFVLTGCTESLKDNETNKIIKNPKTGQNLTENILCKPKDKDTIKIYEKYPKQVDLDNLIECEDLKYNSGSYDGLWSSIIVKPLAFAIIQIGKLVNNYGLSLIITSLIIRLVTYPITRKTAVQSKHIKDAKPEIDSLEEKYKNKTDQESIMKKSQEMSLIYKKHNINPFSSCLFGFLQIPLFIGFLEAINRVPAIFEGSFLGIQLGTTPLIAFQNSQWHYIIIIILVALSTVYSFSLNTSTADNKQTKLMSNMMGVTITFMSIFMSSALGIYWISSNLFTIVQNLIVKKEKKYGKA